MLDTPFASIYLGEIIEGIRLFDPETQRSAESTTTISLLPAREFPITSESIDLFRQNFRRLFEGDPQQQQIYREVSRGNPSQGIDYYFPLFFENTGTLFDYLPDAVGWVIDRALPEASNTFWSGIHDRHALVAEDPERHGLATTLSFSNYSGTDGKNVRPADHPSDSGFSEAS